MVAAKRFSLALFHIELELTASFQQPFGLLV